VKALNLALLALQYGVRGWDIPEGYLCPPIPGRADYVHHLADLLASARGGAVPRGTRGADPRSRRRRQCHLSAARPPRVRLVVRRHGHRSPRPDLRRPHPRGQPRARGRRDAAPISRKRPRSSTACSRPASASPPACATRRFTPRRPRPGRQRTKVANLGRAGGAARAETSAARPASCGAPAARRASSAASSPRAPATATPANGSPPWCRAPPACPASSRRCAPAVPPTGSSRWVRATSAAASSPGPSSAERWHGHP
jgi:hypothetical protein